MTLGLHSIRQAVITGCLSLTISASAQGAKGNGGKNLPAEDALELNRLLGVTPPRRVDQQAQTHQLKRRAWRQRTDKQDQLTSSTNSGPNAQQVGAPNAKRSATKKAEPVRSFRDQLQAAALFLGGSVSLGGHVILHKRDSKITPKNIKRVAKGAAIVAAALGRRIRVSTDAVTAFPSKRITVAPNGFKTVSVTARSNAKGRKILAQFRITVTPNGRMRVQLTGPRHALSRRMTRQKASAR